MHLLPRTLLLALCATTILAKNDKAKIKRPGKLVGANDIYGSNTCYTNCANACVDGGCEVFDGADTSLGSFDCQCTPCAHGEVGTGAYVCDIGGIRDLNAEDTSTSCGGDGFDIALLLGRSDCVVDGPTVTCPGSCECNSCECDPCGAEETCVDKNGRFGGYQCK